MIKVNCISKSLARSSVLLALLIAFGSIAMANNNTYYGRVTTNVSPTGAGTAYVGTSQNPSSGTQAEAPTSTTGGNVTLYLKATPADAYIFSKWQFTGGSGTIADANAASTSVTVKASTNNGSSSDYTVQAVFIAKPIPTFYFSATATADPAIGGSADVELTASSVPGAAWNSGSAQTTASYSATPNSGYFFIGWSTSANGSIESTDNPYNKTVTSTSTDSGNPTNTTMYAIFKQNPTSVSASDVSVYVGGGSQQISVTLTPDDAYRNITYTSNNTGIATVDSDGNVTGVAAGSTTITVKALKKDGTEACSTTSTVTVKDVCETPVISFTPIGNGATANVSITSATQGATIKYVVNGDTPTTTFDGTLVVNSGDVVNAVATKTGYDNSSIASATYVQQQVPTPEIQVAGNRVWFLCDLDGVTFRYTTNGTDPTSTTGTTNTGAEVTINGTPTIKVIATKSGYMASEVASRTMTAAHIVYLDFTNGNDNNSGADASHAKKTWGGAYALLGYGPNAWYLRGQWNQHGPAALYNLLTSNNPNDYTSTVDNNIIYLVGDVSSANFNILNKTPEHPTDEEAFVKPVINAGFFKPATISGKYATSHTYSDGSHYARITLTSGYHFLNEDTRFEYVEFYGPGSNNSTDFILNYYDLEMGKGITTHNFTSTSQFSTYHHGYRQGVTNTAHLQFYGGLVCDTRYKHAANSELNFDYHLPHPDGYKIILRSGFFSTISPGGTQWSQYNNDLNGVMGSPNTPVKCTILVDIDRAWNDDHKSGVVYNDNTPDCDVAVVIAGTHEGSMYGDQNIIIKSGRVYRVVNGSFGANNIIGNYPADSYFGRANILIDPREPSSAEVAKGLTDKNSLVVINELYGGGLGRFKSDSDRANQSSTFFYGKSTVTINGGTFLSALYASGAGGVNGIGDATHHTNDGRLPYMNGNTITYGNYDSWYSHRNTPVMVKCRNSSDPNDYTMVDLAETSTRIEIHGGVFGSAQNPIDGIFGGGYGYVDKELIDYDNTYWNSNNGASKPNTLAGSMFAAAGQLVSSVTIDGDAVIYGNVYGAGRGDDTYFTSNRSDKANYNQLGLISGNVQLTIGGNAAIHGSVFGAGQGINNANLTNMARLYGNSTILIKENATISGGVYGGGQNGSMNGDVDLTILDNVAVGTSESNANVHGGGLGNTTRVLGNIDLKIGENNNGTYTGSAVINGDVYGGSAQGKTNGDSSRNGTSKTDVTLYAGTINGSLYGGGLGTNQYAADVYGPVAVKVYGGSVKQTSADGSGGVYGANNVNGAPQNSVTVDIYGTDAAQSGYALYSVYGGGNKANYTYGNGYPKVTVHNCDNSIEYVYGGGNAAAVASTDVTIYGGNVIGNVFGGGNGTVTAANVTGNATTKIYGGTILNVFGGSNSQGTIGGTISVTADETAEGSNSVCPINITDLYGGGNKAASAAGNITIGCATHIGSVYGGANQADITGNIALNITSGHIDNVFGGNNTSGTINGTIAVTVNDSGSTCGMSVGNVFGGGNLAQFTGSPAVNIYNGSVTGNVYGGGKGDADDHTKGRVTGNPTVTIGDNVQEHQVTIGGSVFGGGDAGNVSGTPVVTIAEKCNTIITTGVYGGGNAADVSGTNVTINGGTIGNAFGGGNGQVAAANVTGNASIIIHGGTIGKAFAGSNTSGSIGGTATITVDKTSSCPESITEVYGGGNEAAGNAGTVTIQCGAVVGDVYGGANKANVNSAITLNITGGTINRVFGGNNTSGSISGNITVNINKADDCNTWDVNNVYGAGNLAAYSGNTTVYVTNGTVDVDVYGGGLGETAVVTGTTTVNLQGGTVTGNLFGGGSLAEVDGSTDVNISSGTVGNVYGGGADADVSGNTDVAITGGTVNHSVFGGGLGSTTNVGGTATVSQSAGTVTEDVYGGSGYGKVQNTAVTISGGSLRNVYGGGFGDKENDYEADINGNVNVTVSGGTLSGDVFGCNNQNGAPKGTVNVTINGTNAITLNNVYGGGNLADATVTPNVTVNGCSATITDLFGGGNAAAVGGTNVVVNGGTFTRVFAGGNGAVSAANVTGNTSLAIHAGDIHQVFGGSNTNGTIGGTMNVTIDHDISGCTEEIDEVYGGGNLAAGGAGILTIECGADNLGDVYGGANQADINGNIVLNITGGEINRVFGGNNTSGTINGTITVNINIDGNDCQGSSLNYVYGGGNAAPYSNAGSYPAVNIIKGTVAHDVYGGGLGSDAVVTGNPIVTICGGTVTDNVFGGGSAAAVTGNTRVVLTSGTVGNIYGGGKQADVSGNTNVNANNGTVNGSVYGGGKAANVGGNATVTIGQ